MPFFDQLERDIHFKKHGAEFGASDPADYERMADAFMFGAIESDARECVRPQGEDRIRFGFITHRLGVACVTPQFIRTFHVVRLRTVRSHRDSAGYFAWQCGRIYT
jgi:hypothetical protein